MRPVHHNMYAQPAYALSPTPVVYPSNGPSLSPLNPLPQYGRSQDPPMYLVHQQPVGQYPTVGIPTEVVGNPIHAHIPAAIGMQPVSGYAQGWMYRTPIVEPAPSTPVWGYGIDRSGGYSRESELRSPTDWQRPPQQGHPGNAAGGLVSFQGRGDGYGNSLGNGAGAPASFLGRAEAYGSAVGNGTGGPTGFQGRGEAYGTAQGPGAGGSASFQGRRESFGSAKGNGAGGPVSFQGRREGQGNAQGTGPGGPASFKGRGDGYGGAQAYAVASSDSRRLERGMDSSNGGRQYVTSAASRPQLAGQAATPCPSVSQAKPLICEACEKNFQIYSQLTAHMNTHVVCDEIGCSFSASGKVVKLHKQSVHSKPNNANFAQGLKPSSKVSEESNEEIRSWREERKKNYPTRSNIQRKKDELQGRLARGELIDADTRRRRQRMKEILAKQAELGVPVAEVPDYYLHSQPHKDHRVQGRKEHPDRITHVGKETPSAASQRRMVVESLETNSVADCKKRKHEEQAKASVGLEDPPGKATRVDSDLVGDFSMKSQSGGSQQVETGQPLTKVKDGEVGTRNSGKNAKSACYFYQRGRCKKGLKCHFDHSGPRGRKGEGDASKSGRSNQRAGALDKKRPPTLLSKLLESSILRDKSYILQYLRFFVNNNFLLDWPKLALGVSNLGVVSDASGESSDISDGEVVEAPDVLAADSAIINTLLSESPGVLANVINGTENVKMDIEV